MAEFYCREIIFQGRGKRFNDMIQFATIVSKLGMPPDSFLQRITSDEIRYAVQQCRKCTPRHTS